MSSVLIFKMRVFVLLVRVFCRQCAPGPSGGPSARVCMTCAAASASADGCNGDGSAAASEPAPGDEPAEPSELDWLLE